MSQIVMRELAAWTFGFLSIPVAIGLVAVMVVGLVAWFDMPSRLELNPEFAVAGAAVFVAVALITGVALFRVLG